MGRGDGAFRSEERVGRSSPAQLQSESRRFKLNLRHSRRASRPGWVTLDDGGSGTDHDSGGWRLSVQ